MPVLFQRQAAAETSRATRVQLPVRIIRGHIHQTSYVCTILPYQREEFVCILNNLVRNQGSTR